MMKNLLLLSSLSVALLILSGCGKNTHTPSSDQPNAPEVPVTLNPAIPAEHPAMATLVGNAFRYLDPAHELVDAASGYPLEGWNDDSSQGLFLRSFTQVTAIGEWIELLACIAAGLADNAVLEESAAYDRLEKCVATLLKDQQDPGLARHGLLVNFLGIEGDKRVGPLTQTVSRSDFDEDFGPAEAAKIWQALIDKGWLQPENQGAEGRVQRSTTFGHKHFTGPMHPYAATAKRNAIMNLLDERAVLVAYGDNANLTTSVAKAIGALCHPSIKSNPRATQLRAQLETFIEAQADGYQRLIDPAAGMFSFGRNETRDRFFGWNTDDGKWVIGHQDYLVNEFRDPTLFVVLRFDLSQNLLRNLGFNIRSVETHDGQTLFTLAPYSGASFQAYGLDLGFDLMAVPAWRQILENLTVIELDYAQYQNHPGFLSESYTGDGTEYSGDVGMPQLAVTKDRRITTAPSLYTLGTAYQVAPDAINAFLASQEATLAKLRTDHGPWEGYQVQKQKPIAFQTTAHTLSLLLGALGNGPENMQRYLAENQLEQKVARAFYPGAGIDFLSAGINRLTWSADGGKTELLPDPEVLTLRCESKSVAGLVLKLPENQPANISGNELILHYTSDQAVPEVRIKIPRGTAPGPGVIPNEIITRFKVTDAAGEVLRIPLPTHPALTDIRSLEVNMIRSADALPVTLKINQLGTAPHPTK